MMINDSVLLFWTTLYYWQILIRFITFLIIWQWFTFWATLYAVSIAVCRSVKIAICA